MDPLHGVLHENRLKAFCGRFGLRHDELEADFSGWHKRAILAPDDAFLFPRYDEDIPLVEREAVALDAVASIDVVPSLRGLHREPEIGPYPFLQTERRFGTNYSSIEDDLTLDEVGAVLEQVGVAIAAWHDLDVRSLHEKLHELPWEPTPSEAMDAGVLRAELECAFERLSRVLPEDVRPDESAVDVWELLLEPLWSLAPVLTHGDVHETQLLVDDDRRLTTVLDWDHACVANPVRDFNFGEWGFGIFAWEERFDVLYERYWEAYRRARDASLPDHRSVVLYRALGDATWAAAKLAETPQSWFHALRIRRSMAHVRAVSEWVA